MCVDIAVRCTAQSHVPENCRVRVVPTLHMRFETCPDSLVGARKWRIERCHRMSKVLRMPTWFSRILPRLWRSAARCCAKKTSVAPKVQVSSMSGAIMDPSQRLRARAIFEKLAEVDSVLTLSKVIARLPNAVPRCCAGVMVVGCDRPRAPASAPTHILPAVAHAPSTSARRFPSSCT